jgi:diaminopimelate epimerase
MHFSKYHALGNDYLVVEADATSEPPGPERVRRLCHRHLGVGADGVLVSEPDASAHRLRIFNPDGSEAEKSGNGLRIFARWLFDRGLVGEDPFTVEVPAGSVRCRVLAGGRAVSVDMGRVSFRSERIPVAGPPREVLRETLEIDGRPLKFSAATIGNPHCVILRDAVSEAEARALGPRIETHPLFPRRTNVQLVEVVDRVSRSGSAAPATPWPRARARALRQRWRTDSDSAIARCAWSCPVASSRSRSTRPIP